MKTLIVLAMHGMPPRDFTVHEKKELMRLRSQFGARGEQGDAAQKSRIAELDLKIRRWPRTRENDPFWFASEEIATELNRTTGLSVIVGYNEFCSPNMDEALDQAAQTGASEVIVLTPMMIRGGNHAEEEIPEALRAAANRHPQTNFRYAWPFTTEKIAEFLAAEIRSRQ